MSHDLIAQLTAHLGAKGVITDPQDMAPWLTDWRGRWTGRALAIAAPQTVEEVSAVVSLAAAHRVPLVPQGGNTSMVGGATPDETGNAVILSLRRMNRIRDIDGAAGCATAEAGVILENLHIATEELGWRFPLSLGAKGSATIGGLAATNAGGTQVLRFGTMRKLVLGLEAVLPDGSIYHGLAALKKDNRGYDLTQLLIGAEGTLGVITAASLKLYPAVVDHATAWIGLASPQAALELLRYVEARAGSHVESFELVPKDSLALVLQHIPNTRAPLAAAHPWNVLLEFTESEAGRSAGDALETLIGSALERDMIADAVVARNETQSKALWRLRESISEAERADGPAMQHDISVPVAAMPDFMIDAARAIETEFVGVTASAFGHLGDGNVHFHVRAPKGVNGAEWRATVGEAASHRVHDLVVAAQGSVSAEHGIGQMKREELLRLSDPARLHALRAIKAGLDPLNIMNPGKLISLASVGQVQ
jgi:FAD/FMN-containing dehydrogenase